MKIIIHSLDELLALSALIRRSEPEIILRHDPVKDAQGAALLREALRKEQGNTLAGLGQISAKTACEMGLEEPEGLPTDIEQPVNSRGQTYDEAVAATAQLHEAIIGETLDADGVPHTTDWHSEPAKINADGRWKARRGRDHDAYKAWLSEQSVFTDGPVDADEAEPVATETHALPQDELSDEDSREVGADYAGEGGKPQAAGSEPSAAPAAPVSAVDLEALIAASLEAAQDASDSHVELLNACRDFTSKHGHPQFTALKAAVAPEDAGGGGKAVQHFTPGERRLMQACIANYPSN